MNSCTSFLYFTSLAFFAVLVIGDSLAISVDIFLEDILQLLLILGAICDVLPLVSIILCATLLSISFRDFGHN